MLAENAQTQRLSTDSRHTLLRGGWLWTARAVWIALASAAVLFFATNVRLLYSNNRLPCAQVEDEVGREFCFAQQPALDALGITRDAHTLLFIIGVIIQIVPWILLGLLIFWRRSQYPMEFVFSLTMVMVTSTNLDQGLATWAFHYYPDLRIAFVLLQHIGGALVLPALLLFPDGRFISPMTRILAVVWVAMQVAWFITDVAAIDTVFWSIEIVLSLAAVGALIYRYRAHSNAVQRQQIKWAVAGISLLFVTRAVILQISFDTTTTQGIIGQLLLAYTLYLVSLVAALSLAISILRYKLWNLDFIINRALVYGALTLVLGAIFVAAFFPLRALWLAILGEGQEVVAAVLPAVFVALIFSPTQKRMRHFVDSRVYGIKVDYIGAARADDSQPAASTSSGARTSFGVYSGLSLLGRGGMGEVYRALHPTLNRRTVAIKILPPHAHGDDDAQRRFVREAQTIARLKHPNIVTLHEFGEQDGQPFMVMEYIDGPDLSAMIKQQGRLSLTDALPILQDIAAALDYTHQQGVVHRDIKPSNVMVEHVTATGSGRTSRAVLMDFGIAKSYAATSRLTHSGMIGTLDYISPEQIQGSSEVDHRADIYSLGVMAYQMLTGKVPFEHGNPGAMVLAHLMHPPANPRQLAPDLPAHAADALLTALAKSPQARFAAAGEFVSRLAGDE